MLKSIVQSVLISIAVTFAIGLGLRFTGVMDSFFFRPNDRVYDAPGSGWLEHRDVTFQSDDGTALHGWFFPAQSPVGTIVHLHGSDGNITGTARNVIWLIESGYNVFAFDYRGYGRSEGSPSREGVIADARAAYRYARTIPEVDPERIVLFGQSMGGQLAIHAALDAQPPAAVIAEATYASYADHLFDKMAQITFASIFRWPMWLIASDTGSADQVVAHLKSPLLIIHGTHDKGVRPHHSERLYQLAPDPKQLWLVENAQHLRVFKQSPFKDTYRPRLITYLNRILNQ